MHFVIKKFKLTCFFPPTKIVLEVDELGYKDQRCAVVSSSLNTVCAGTLQSPCAYWISQVGCGFAVVLPKVKVCSQDSVRAWVHQSMELETVQLRLETETHKVLLALTQIRPLMNAAIIISYLCKSFVIFLLFNLS